MSRNPGRGGPARYGGGYPGLNGDQAHLMGNMAMNMGQYQHLSYHPPDSHQYTNYAYGPIRHIGNVPSNSGPNNEITTKGLHMHYNREVPNTYTPLRGNTNQMVYPPGVQQFFPPLYPPHAAGPFNQPFLVRFIPSRTFPPRMSRALLQNNQPPCPPLQNPLPQQPLPQHTYNSNNYNNPQPPPAPPTLRSSTKGSRAIPIINPETNENVMEDVESAPSVQQRTEHFSAALPPLPGPVKHIPLQNLQHSNTGTSYPIPGYASQYQPSSPPIPMVPSQILQRPYSQVQLLRPPKMSPPPLPTTTSPPRPCSNSSPGHPGQCQLVNESRPVEVNGELNVSPPPVPSSNAHSVKPPDKHVPTVSALSTGPEVDLADLKLKALLSSKPMTTQNTSLVSNQIPNSLLKNRSKLPPPLPPNNSHFYNGVVKSEEIASHPNSSPPLPQNSHVPSNHLSNSNALIIPQAASPHQPENPNLSVVNENPAKQCDSIEGCTNSPHFHANENFQWDSKGLDNKASDKQVNYSNMQLIVLKRTDNAAAFFKNSKPEENFSSNREQNDKLDQATSEDPQFPYEVVLPSHPTYVDSHCQTQYDSSEDSVSVASEILDYERRLSTVTEESSANTFISSGYASETSTVPDIREDMIENLPPPSLKYNYHPDQWSPLNQDGSKKYSREFLCELQKEALSQQKPTNLPDLEIVIKDPSKVAHKNHFPVSMLHSNARINDSFTPHYLNKNFGVVRMRPPLKRSTSQPKLPKLPHKPVQNIVLSISLKDEVKLRETENAWRPNINTQDEDENLYKEVRSVLNKLTPQNFESLVQKFKRFPINNKTRLDKVIDLVFQKAIAEPGFSEFYAKMCFEMMKMEVIDESKPLTSDEKCQSVNFKGLLLDKCQSVFEKNTSDESDARKKLMEINAVEDLEKRKDLLLQYEEEERLLRKRSVSNCRFIGELFKLNMLTSKIIHHCIKILLGKVEEEPLECACKLLSTIGQDLDKDNNTLMSNYFKTMTDLVSKKNSYNISSRVKFMLQDVIELRMNMWVPRRNENKPKTIQQIQFEADSEKMGLNLNNKKTEDRRVQSSMENRKLAHNTKDMGAWITQKSYKSNFPFDKQKFLQLRDDSSDVKLEPCDKVIWIQGSNIYNKYSPVEKSVENEFKKHPEEMKTLMDSNCFSPLNNSELNPDQMNTSRPPPVSYNKNQPPPTISGNSTHLLSTNQSVCSSGDGGSSNCDHTSSGPLSNTETSSPSEEFYLQKKRNTFKSLLEEYFCNGDITDLLHSKGTNSISDEEMCFFVFDVGTQSFSQEYHARVSDFLIEARKLCIESRSIQQAMSDFFSYSLTHDLYKDRPDMSRYLAEIIAPLLENDTISFEDFKSSALLLIKGNENRCYPLIREILVILGYHKAPSWVQSKWNSSRYLLTEFLPKGLMAVDLETSYPFYFLTALNYADFTSACVPEYCKEDNLKNRIKDIFISHDVAQSFDNINLVSDVALWIQGNFGPVSKLDTFVISTLAEAVCELGIKKKEIKTNEDFCEYICVFKKLDLNQDQQCEVLNSICKFVQRLDFPEGLVLEMYQCLHKEKVISTDVFTLWKQSTQCESKQIALKQLSSFYEHLTEEETSRENDS